MTLPRVASIVLTLAACLAVWIVRSEILSLLGTLVWDLRYVLLGVAAVIFLTLAEWFGQPGKFFD